MSRLDLPTGLAVSLALALAPNSVSATEYTILTTADDGAPGDCSLRDAIRASDQDLAVDACAAGELLDIIYLPPAIYDFSHGHEHVDSAGSISIVALGGFAIIDLGNQNRFLAMADTSVTLVDLTIRNGSDTFGGALLATSTDLTLDSVDLEFNSTSASGGALHFSGGSANTLIVVDSFFAANTAGQGGGGAFVMSQVVDNATIRDTQFTGNEARQGGGLSLQSAGTASCVRCHFSQNRASGLGGGAHVLGLGSGVARIVDSDFSQNWSGAEEDSSSSLSAEAFEGLVEVDRVSSQNSHGKTADVNLHAHSYGTITLTNALIVHGDQDGIDALATQDGQVQISFATIARNSTGVGARLIAQSGGLIRLQNSIVALNGLDLLITPTGVEYAENLVGEDPLFDASQPPFHLSSNSPAVDGCNAQGVPTRVADLDHRPRVFGPSPDCGTYESGLGIFADGFESEDEGSWSSSSP